MLYSESIRNLSFQTVKAGPLRSDATAVALEVADGDRAGWDAAVTMWEDDAMHCNPDNADRSRGAAALRPCDWQGSSKRFGSLTLSFRTIIAEKRSEKNMDRKRSLPYTLLSSWSLLTLV